MNPLLPPPTQIPRQPSKVPAGHPAQYRDRSITTTASLLGTGYPRCPRSVTVYLAAPITRPPAPPVMARNALGFAESTHDSTAPVPLEMGRGYTYDVRAVRLHEDGTTEFLLYQRVGTDDVCELVIVEVHE